MSSSEPCREPIRYDYTQPIARTGEQQFGCILRNRSGFDAGKIDFGARDCSGVPDADHQAIVDAVFALQAKVLG